MMKNSIMFPAIVDSVRDLKDKSGKLSFVTRELTNEEFGQLRDMHGLEGWLLFKENELKEEEIPQEDADLNTKTPSQRMRAVIFVLYKQSKENGKTEKTFNEFYHDVMEWLIQSVKNKLDN